MVGPKIRRRSAETEDYKEDEKKLDDDEAVPSLLLELASFRNKEEVYRRRGVGGGVDEEQADEDAGRGREQSAMKESMWLEDSRVSCASAREVVRCNKTRRRSERVREERDISWPRLERKLVVRRYASLQPTCLHHLKDR